MSHGRVLDAELPGLLSDLAEAPDFDAAAMLLLEQLADAVSARRAALFVLDQTFQQLELRLTFGFPRPDVSPIISLDEAGHPLTVVAAGNEVVLCDGSGVRGIPFPRAVLVPLAQARYRGGPAPLAERPLALDTRYDGCRVFAWSGGERQRRFGHAVFAVLAIEGRPDDQTIDALANAALLAGPVLARSHTLDGLQRRTQRLEEQRSLLTTIINALPDPIIITDASNRIVVQNARAQLLLTPGEDDSEGRRRAIEINNLLFSSFLAKSVLGGTIKPNARELNLVDPREGGDLLFEVLAHPLPAMSTRSAAYVSVLRDVTDLRRASIELERQYSRARVTEMEATRERDRLNLLLENVADPILVTDNQAKIIQMNAQAEQLFEAPSGSVSRQYLQRVRGNDTRFTTLISDFALSSAVLRRERISLTHPQEGREFPVEVVAGKVLNERSEPIAIVSVLHDLTKQVENERLNDELKTLNAELEDRIRAATADLAAQNLRLQWQSNELERAYRLKSEFLANMSHELRTPINALIGYTALMLDRIYGELTPKQVEGLTRIQASSQHLLSLINDILDLARIEAGKMPIHLEPIDLRPVLAEAAAQIEPLARRKSLEFKIDIDERLPLLYTDPTKVKQIVLNLLSNAVKFTNRGSVALSAAVADSNLIIQVKDTGIGIRPQHLDVIFEEFRQVDQSRTREYGGTGLGLSITRKLILLLGGQITVESEFGKGSTFTVTLPLHSPHMSVDEQVTRAAIGVAAPPS